MVDFAKRIQNRLERFSLGNEQLFIVGQRFIKLRRFDQVGFLLRGSVVKIVGQFFQELLDRTANRVRRVADPVFDLHAHIDFAGRILCNRRAEKHQKRHYSRQKSLFHPISTYHCIPPPTSAPRPLQV